MLKDVLQITVFILTIIKLIKELLPKKKKKKRFSKKKR